MDDVRRAERQNKAVYLRMYRDQVACAECRRIKLKCDKKVPCSSCVRRDCSNICPTGTLASRQETRTLLVEGSSGREEQNEIARLRERILQLENALALDHSYVSKETHPLLVKLPNRQPRDNPEAERHTKLLVNPTVGDGGDVEHFEPFAEILYEAASAIEKIPPSPPVSSHSDPDSTTDSLFTHISRHSPLDMESFVSFILTDLPERTQASSLCDVFYNTTTYSMPIQREELVQNYLFPMYKYIEDSSTNQSLPIPLTTFRPHRCAVPFFVFAIAAWLDLTQEQYWIEADRYFRVGLLCLSMQSIFYSPEVASVQALFLLASYKEFQGGASTFTPSPSWTIISLACKIAQGLGLHRDNSQWNLDDITVQRRRWLYWELISIEALFGLRTGRPISCRPSYIDTELPNDVGLPYVHGQPLQGFFRWKHEAARDCYLGLVDILAAATPATYDVILELDRKVRAKEIPPHLNRILIDTENGNNHELNVPIQEFFQSWLLGMARSMILLAIHRTHFSKALQEPSGNPLKSPYAPSFVASYRAASWIIKCYHAAQKRFPNFLPRLWHSWTNVMTAAMVLGSIAVDTPSCRVGNTPLEELRIASSMFEEVAVLTVSPRTKNGAMIVQKILARAEEAQAQYLAEHTSVVQAAICIPPINCGDDELAIFGGQNRLLSRGSLQTSTQPRQGSKSHNSDSPSSSGSLDDVHPSLIDFLATAPVSLAASSMTLQDMEGTFGPPPVSPFHDPGFVPPQPYDWDFPPLPTPQNQYYFENIDSSTSEFHIFDKFENYLNPPVPPADFGSEPNTLTPWQNFMRQQFLTE